MDTLAITIVQSHLHWENPEANRAHFTSLIEGLQTSTDLIVLPEMFTTGFTMNAAPLAESDDGPTLRWMQQIATQHDCAVTGSVIIKTDGNYYNRLYFVHPDQSIERYDKRHTFTLAKEHEIYTAGIQQLVVDYRGWKLLPLICYDLRFPVWARNTMDYDLLLYVANWPKVRVSAWDALLKARAIENMCYCVGVNRVGLDGNGYEYTGHSAVYDVLGTLISSSELEQEFVETVQLSKDHINTNRSKLQFLQDRDSFTLD
ncbi:MAG: amidohydrolase [Bacteroidota bacterium]